MNCISIQEPYASAIICGLKKGEYRNFRIKLEKTLIHVSLKPAMNKKEIIAFYREIKAPISAAYYEVAFGVKKQNNYFKLEDKTVVQIKDVDTESNDFRLVEMLARNLEACNGNVFLYGRIIGQVDFIKHKTGYFNGYNIANVCKNPELFSLKESIFYKGRLGQYSVNL